MSLDPVENDSQEIGSEDNERIMLIGSDENSAENVNGSQADESRKMKEDAEEGELEDGELDDEPEELCGQSDQPIREPSPDGTSSVAQVPESESLPVKNEKRRERSDPERKSKGHGHHRGVPRPAAFDGIADVGKEDEGKETHGRPQPRHGKRRDKQRGKEDSEKKKTNYSTYIDFDDIQDDFETDDGWMGHGSRSKRSRRSRDSLRGPYDSPSGSGDDDFDVDDEAQSSSRNYRSQYQYNYGGFYETLPEEDEDDEDNEPMDQNSDYTDSKGHYMKHPSQDGGYKGSPGGYHRSSSSERKTRNQMPRKRKLVDTPMEERPACKFFREGKCVKGSDCPFNHDFVPPKKEDVCRFYLNERGCTRENCVYYHADWPCRHFHRTGSCTYGDSCKFSHADLTDETKHLIYLESSDDYHSENWRSSNDLSQASEKKKIPSLLDLEIYPPGQEPKIPSPSFSPRGPYKRQRSSGQPGLLGAGPQMSGGSGSRMSSRMRQMGCNSKGYYSSYGDQFGMDDSSPPQQMYSPDNNNTQDDGGDEEPYNQNRSGDEDDQDQMTSMTDRSTDLTTGGGQSAEVSNLPPVQRDLYRRIQQNQQFPQNTLSQTSNNNAQIKEKWYSSDEEGDGCDTMRASETTPSSTSVTPSNIIQSLAGQTSQMQKPLKPDSVQSMPSMFGMPPPCGLMPRGMPPPREMMHPPDMMMSQGPRPMQGMPPRPEMMLPQRNMTPLQDMMSKGMGGMMLPQTMAPPPDMMPPTFRMQHSDMMGQGMMQHSDMMGQGMMLPRNMMGQGMMPPRGMMPPSDMMGQGMMPPRGMMPPSDMMGQGMMPPRGVPPPSDMMSLSMMQQRGMAPPSDMMPQGMLPQGVKAPSDMPLRAMAPPGMPQSDGMPSPFSNLQTQGIGPFDINHILSVIRNSTLQLPPNLLLPPTTTTDIMANASSNFNQSHDPRTSGNMVDPRLQVSEPPPSDVGMMMPVSSFLQPPESPDQEIEINAAGKKIPYVLRPITIDSRPGPPSSINLENLHNSSDPRLQKYLNHNQTNAKTRSGNNEMDSSDSVVPAKPTDPRLSKRGGGGGGSEARNPGDVESGNNGNKGTKQQKPYTLPDIVLPVLSTPVQDKTSTVKVTNSTVSTRKAALDDPAPRATSTSPPSIKPVDKTSQNLVELPEALQERNFPMDGRLSRQSSTGSVGHVSTNADKKVIDYRNDPRYKKKKTKPLLEELSVVQPLKLGKVKEESASVKEEWTSEHNTVTEPVASDSSTSKLPFGGNFKVPHQEFAEEGQDAEAEDSDSFNPESQKSEATSVHTPVNFFEGVPTSSILSDVEPTQELNLKDMFKTIDPTTSPFC